MKCQVQTKGFTLIELLIVITIIGILSSIVIARVTGAKQRAQDAKTFASLRGAQGTALFCMDDGDNLSVPNIANDICAGRGKWPAPVGNGWAYGDFGACAFDGDVSDGSFMYCANDGVEVIACTEDLCMRT